MRLGWLLLPLVLLAGGEAPAQGMSHSAAGDQLAALVELEGQSGLVLKPREDRLDLAYDVRRLPRTAERFVSRPAEFAGRAEPSLDGLGLPLQGEGALVDIYPFREGLRITAGARADLTDARFIARVWEPMGESDRVIAATLFGKDDDITPYVGIGYARRMLDGRLQVAVDAGVLFDREYESGEEGDASAALSSVAGAAERSGGGTSAEVYPVVGLSMKYRF